LSRTIVKPGYHLKPKYDLPGLRARQNSGGGHKSVIIELPLTSMIDMFTILVIFLLMNFSSTGEIFFIQKNLVLPTANHAHPIESNPLISVTSSGVTLETQKVGDNPISITESDQNLPRLAAALKQIRIIEETVHPGEPFKGAVNIQADEKTPLVYIKRVMQTCITEGWHGINFAVRTADSAAPTGETSGPEDSTSDN
jgi:biopolymer transport protein ExbD